MLNNLLDNWDGGRSTTVRIYDLFFIIFIAGLGHVDFWFIHPQSSIKFRLMLLVTTIIALVYLIQLPRLVNNSNIPYKLLILFYFIYAGCTFVLTDTLTNKVLGLAFWPRLLVFVVLESILLTRTIETHPKK
ncbi:hypothetical protein [Leuconostoc litchii]|uniref:Uncharacterized protein n=1 Tax=Leuconostoc litchii TaxID=1981069 RepID=A0A6P2CN92_9LACO|nr:hypothetical protein [Leuconostoc litchii]TYC47400.1 hypothetical protein ESZ47_04480 [Leuconostoc litchii]